MYKIAEALILFSSALGRKHQALQCLGLQQVLVYFVCWALLPRTGRANALFVSDVFGKKRCFVCLTSETRHRTLTSFKDTALNRDNMKPSTNVWGFFCMWFGKSKLLCHHGWRLFHQEPFSLLRSWYTLLPMTFPSSICLSSHTNSGTKLFIQLYFWSTNELKNQNVANMFFPAYMCVEHRHAMMMLAGHINIIVWFGQKNNTGQEGKKEWQEQWRPGTTKNHQQHTTKKITPGCFCFSLATCHCNKQTFHQWDSGTSYLQSNAVAKTQTQTKLETYTPKLHNQHKAVTNKTHKHDVTGEMMVPHPAPKKNALKKKKH